MQKLSVTRNPYYHIHIDGKREVNKPYSSFARGLGFFEMPFSRKGDQPPLTHLTKKYSRMDLEKMRRDFELLKSAAEPLDYTGYIECEEIIWRCALTNNEVDQSVTKIEVPFRFTHRQLRVDKGESFKEWDVHITISSNSNKAVLWALNESGLLRVYPLYNTDKNLVIYTAQFPKEDNVEQRIKELRQAIAHFIRAYSKHMHFCTIKIEKIVDYFTRNVRADDLPLVVGSLVT